jgi:hypothetical protein
MKTTLFALLCLTLVSCAIGYNPRMFYSYIEVANHSGDTISNVELQMGADGRYLRCDTVTKNRICHERFSKRRYPQQIVELSWQDSAGKLHSQQLNPSIPATLSPGNSMRILFKIKADGSVKVDIREDQIRMRSSVFQRLNIAA